MFGKSSFVRDAFIVTAAVVCMSALPGCGSKVTADNFAKVHQGQSETDVQGILGKPTTSEPGKLMPGITIEEWKDGDKMISIGVANGVVITVEKTGF